MSTVRSNNYYDANGTSNAVLYGVAAPTGSMGFRNRIINGNMAIDQRNAGASVTPANGAYTLDRWAANNFASSGKFSVQQSSVAPAGFNNSLLVTSLSAYSIASGDLYAVYQTVEGFNVADLGWGAAGAQTVTLSFWVRSSLTGTFGGAFQNDAGDRAYPFAYTIAAANTWEQKTITVAGDTTGTWLKTNGGGVTIKFGLGVGSTRSSTAGAWAAGNFASSTGATSVVATNGATFYITGVQLEAGSVASPFERRDYGRELMMCQRYYYKQQATGTSDYFGNGHCTGTTTLVGTSNFPVSMRTTPSALGQTGTAANYSIYFGAGVTTACSSVPTFVVASQWSASSLFTIASGLTTGQGGVMRSNNAAAYLAWSAEL
jgi:hypothetical protein